MTGEELHYYTDKNPQKVALWIHLGISNGSEEVYPKTTLGLNSKGLWNLTIFTELLTSQDQSPGLASITDGSMETYTILNDRIVPKFQVVLI